MFYRVVRWVLKVFFMLFYRVRVTGSENVPASGGFVVCANHISALDPPLVGVILPRPVHFMAKAELFRYPVLGEALPWVGAFPVRRGRADRKALRHAIGLVEDGKVLGMFPEGTRSKSGELQDPKGGAAFIAIRTGVPVLPVGICSSYKLGAKIEVIIGNPFVVNADAQGSGRIDSAGQQIMEGIHELLENR